MLQLLYLLTLVSWPLAFAAPWPMATPPPTPKTLATLSLSFCSAPNFQGGCTNLYSTDPRSTQNPWFNDLDGNCLRLVDSRGCPFTGSLSVSKYGTCTLYKGGCKDENTLGCCKDQPLKGATLTWGKDNTNQSSSEMKDIGTTGLMWIRCGPS